MKRLAFGFVVLVVLLSTGIAHATLYTTYDEAEFLTWAGAVTMESFENILPTDPADVLYNIPASDLDGHFDVNTDHTFLQIWGPSVSFAPDGDQVLFWYTTSTPDTAGSITFSNFNDSSTVINAFGLCIIDWASSEAEGVLTFSNEIGDSFMVASSPPSRPDYDTFFFGVISDTPFTEATLTTTTDDGWNFCDRVYYGSDATPIPEPATMLLVGSGLIGLAGFRRKFKKKSKGSPHRF